MKSVSMYQLERIAADPLARAWIQQAFDACADEFGIQVWQLCGSSKTREVAHARAVLVQVLREKTQLSWVAMSLILGKHHSAMIYASRHDGLADHVRRVASKLPAIPAVLRKAAGAQVATDRTTAAKLGRWSNGRRDPGNGAVENATARCPGCGLDQPPRANGCAVLGMVRCAACGRMFAPFVGAAD